MKRFIIGLALTATIMSQGMEDQYINVRYRKTDAPELTKRGIPEETKSRTTPDIQPDRSEELSARGRITPQVQQSGTRRARRCLFQ